MKCRACGYESEPDGGKYFIPVEVHALVAREANWGPDIKEDVQVYACPKCGTLKIEAWYIHEDMEE
jgi:rubredoxin